MSTPETSHTARSIEADRAGLAWQLAIWAQYAPLFAREVDTRFSPVVEQVIARAALRPGQRVRDLGTGTGSVPIRAASLVAPGGQVLGVDLSTDMLAVARQRVAAFALAHCSFREGRGEAIPADVGGYDVLLASLSLMYVIDRAAAAREIARVLRPSGRFVAAVWAVPEQCDLVLFQQTVGRFAPTPPSPVLVLGHWRSPRRS